MDSSSTPISPPSARRGKKACGSWCFEWLCGMSGDWIDDGTRTVAAKVGATFVVEGALPNDIPVNARFSKSLKSGDYFEVTIQELSRNCTIGIATGQACLAAQKQRVFKASTPCPEELNSEYVIQLDRRDGTNLGVEVTTIRKRDVKPGVPQGLKIVDLSPNGLIAEWNSQRPASKVQKEDLIIEVNGISGDGDKIYEELAQHKIMQVKLKSSNPAMQQAAMQQPFIGMGGPVKPKPPPMKGLFYGGNGCLFNGSQQVTEGYGELLKAGDVIGVMYEVCKIIKPKLVEVVSLTFYHNGRCLGPAFVSNLETPGAQVFPVVQAYASGDKFMCRFVQQPQVRHRESKHGNKHPTEGSWLLRKALFGPELAEYPLSQLLAGRYKANLKVEAFGPGRFHLSETVVNSFPFEATSKRTMMRGPFEEFKAVGHTSTAQRMPAPQSVLEVEDKLQEWIPSCHKWHAKDDVLYLQGPNVELEFSAAAGTFPPCEDFPLS